MDNFEQIISEADSSTKDVKTKADLANLKAKYLGKNSPLISLMGQLKSLDKSLKAEFGKKINLTKNKLNDLFEAKLKELEEQEIKNKIENDKIDITLPGYKISKGSYHPIQLIVDQIEDFFLERGYQVKQGSDVELEKFNFEFLNIPQDHPSRDMQDTFYISDSLLLRSQTSGIQAHVMQESDHISPIKIICPGKTYRRDDDRTHSHQFSQCEGLVISKDANLACLMNTLTEFLQYMFGESRKVRFRPSYFPFTEPSIEADVSCFECGGKGCDLCKHTGWIEVLGAGMVHPNVLKLNGFDPDVYQGFAFGVGIERLAMLKYGVDDIRKFFNNDVTFLNQFVKEE